MIGAGGNTGAAITKVIFFVGSRSSPNLTSQEGLKWMGVMVSDGSSWKCYTGESHELRKLLDVRLVLQQEGHNS